MRVSSDYVSVIVSIESLGESSPMEYNVLLFCSQISVRLQRKNFRFTVHKALPQVLADDNDRIQHAQPTCRTLNGAGKSFLEF